MDTKQLSSLSADLYIGLDVGGTFTDLVVMDGADASGATRRRPPRDGSSRAFRTRSSRRIRLHADLELREHCCPACATLLESEVARRDRPSRATIRLTRGVLDT